MNQLNVNTDRSTKAVEYDVSDISILVVSPASFNKFRSFFEDADEIERLLVEQHQHRYQMFVDFMQWRSGNIGTYEFLDPTTGEDLSLEYDAFDRDNAIYSIAVDPEFRFRGCTRATSSLLPTMLDLDEFRFNSFHAGTSINDWKRPTIFEGTRIISPDSKVYADRKETNPIKGGVGLPLLYSHLELAMDMGLEGSIGTMPPQVQQKLYGRMGLPVKDIGPPVLITDGDGHELDEGVPTQAYAYKVNPEILETVRRQMSAAISLKLLGEYQVPDRMNDYGVPPEVLPQLLQHMTDNLHIEHPHRLETDLSFANPDAAFAGMSVGEFRL